MNTQIATLTVLLAAESLAAHPLITVRLNASSRLDDFRKIVEINRTHPGSVDEYWFGRCGAGPDYATLRTRAAVQVPMKPVCEKAGISVGFQQGVTLGHGLISDVTHPFSDNAWQIGKDGKRLQMLCPRSPEVLAYEENYASIICEVLNPVSLWLDDDLRLGFSKPDGCYCTNCIAQFNAAYKHDFTREQLVEHVWGKAEKDVVRREWLDFLSESLALFGAAARRGVNRVNPDCFLAYQSVDAVSLETGRDYTALLNALSDKGAHPTSIRIGSGCYDEDLFNIIDKMLTVAFEAERVRRSGVRLSAVSYEQEPYPREALHKTPEAIAVESALAMANGCDAVTEYYWDEKRPEPLFYYEEFAATMAEWRPYFERLAALARRTSLGGAARFIGSDYDVIAKRSLRSQTDRDLARLGIPVTVAPSGTKIFYVDANSLLEWGEGDIRKLLANGSAALVSAECREKFLKLGGTAATAAVNTGRIGFFDFNKITVRPPCKFPTHAERATLQDAFDKLAGVRVPVRVERSHPFYVYPRVLADGRLAGVTFYNGAAGKAFPTQIRLRNAAGKAVRLVRPCVKDETLAAQAEGDELIVTLPAVPARQLATLILD